MNLALAAGLTDITILSPLTAGSNSFTIPSGTTVRNYWNIGDGNKLVVKAGAKLRWSAGESNNLLVGNSNDAYLKLASGASLTITGTANGIDSYELTGNGTVNQQNGEPFVVGANETFTVKAGATLNIGAATSDNPVLSVHSNNAFLDVKGTLALVNDSRVVLGDGLNSIDVTGSVTGNSVHAAPNGRLFGLIDGNNEAVVLP